MRPIAFWAPSSKEHSRKPDVLVVLGRDDRDLDAGEAAARLDGTGPGSLWVRAALLVEGGRLEIHFFHVPPGGNDLRGLRGDAVARLGGDDPLLDADLGVARLARLRWKGERTDGVVLGSEVFEPNPAVRWTRPELAARVVLGDVTINRKGRVASWEVVDVRAEVRLPDELDRGTR